MQSSEWIKAIPNYTKNLPKLAFPLQGAMPEIYVPESTILHLQDDTRIHTWMWCYLERKRYGQWYVFNPLSLSAQRVKDLPRAVERLSKRYRFDNTRSRTIETSVMTLSSFLYWLDDPHNQSRYESILSDPDLALEALKKYHTHLRQLMQSNHSDHPFRAAAASNRDAGTVKSMSIIHDRQYGDEIEIIKSVRGDGVKPPKAEDVAAFMACMEGIFDSVTRIVLDEPQKKKHDLYLGDLRWQSGGQECTASIPAGTHIERVMELGCMAYAALCLGDSGSNLSQIQDLEEPENLREKLERPNKLNLRLKVIKFRAGGKVVPLHLSATTVTRMKVYLDLREALRLRIDCPDIGPMFIKCSYNGHPYTKPLAIIPLNKKFSGELRSKLSFFGIELPPVTSRQFRAYKQGVLVKNHNLKVAADMMGTTLTTAIVYYSKITDTERRLEMAPFMANLTSVVLARAKDDGKDSKPTIPLTEIPPGGCEDHGHPKPQEVNPLVKPDCKKTEGCFFCDNFRVHADETDATKLMSCRYVLERLAPSLGDSGAAEKVYDVVLSRVSALLIEIKNRAPEAHERARLAVEEEGHRSPYWATKLQQLHWLGMIPPTAPGSER